MKYSVKVRGKSETKQCKEGQSLMDSLCVFYGYTPKGCHNGGCGICLIIVHKGEYETKKMNKRHVSEDEIAKNIFLACKVFPKSDMEIEFIQKEKPKHYCFGDKPNKGK